MSDSLFAVIYFMSDVTYRSYICRSLQIRLIMLRERDSPDWVNIDTWTYSTDFGQQHNTTIYI